MLTAIREGLLIVGWVAMWRPIEVILFERVENHQNMALFDRLSHIEVGFAPEETDHDAKSGQIGDLRALSDSPARSPNARDESFYDSACAILSVDDRRRGVGEFEMKLRPLVLGVGGIGLARGGWNPLFLLECRWQAGGSVDAYLAS